MNESEIKQLYETARNVLPGEALQMVRNANTDEEHNFFAYIADMNLQRAQWEYINSSEDGWILSDCDFCVCRKT